MASDVIKAVREDYNRNKSANRELMNHHSAGEKYVFLTADHHDPMINLFLNIIETYAWPQREPRSARKTMMGIRCGQEIQYYLI